MISTTTASAAERQQSNAAKRLQATIINYAMSELRLSAKRYWNNKKLTANLLHHQVIIVAFFNHHFSLRLMLSRAPVRHWALADDWLNHLEFWTIVLCKATKREEICLMQLSTSTTVHIFSHGTHHKVHALWHIGCDSWMSWCANCRLTVNQLMANANRIEATMSRARKMLFYSMNIRNNN